MGGAVRAVTTQAGGIVISQGTEGAYAVAA